MSEQAWWKRGLAWVKKQYEVPIHAAESKSALRATDFELVPGQLSAHVYDHLLPMADGTIPCWSYVTSGLERHQQPEIIFTLAHTVDDTVVPEDPLRLFHTINELAETGRLVRAGGVTQFGERKFLGRHLAYIAPQKLPGVAVPQTAICAILVTDDEVAAIQEFGITRVTARLGQAARYYPCPPWSDPSRPGISFAQTRKQTVLARVPRLGLSGCRVYQAEGQVVLLLAKGSGRLLANQLAELPRDSPFALLTELDADADGCFVWEPGQSGPVAITPEGSTGKRICGCFLTFAAGLAEDGALGLEDGFGAFLTPQSWRAIQEAIGQEERRHIPPTGGRMAFVVDWDNEVSQNPVDGKSYVAPGPRR